MDWQPIHSAPTGRKVLVWWPLVALIELNGETGQVVGGEMMISVRARGGWELPDVMNTVITTLDGRYDFTENPSHWQELPSRPPGTVHEASQLKCPWHRVLRL